MALCQCNLQIYGEVTGNKIKRFYAKFCDREICTDYIVQNFVIYDNTSWRARRCPWKKMKKNSIFKPMALPATHECPQKNFSPIGPAVRPSIRNTHINECLFLLYKYLKCSASPVNLAVLLLQSRHCKKKNRSVW